MNLIYWNGSTWMYDNASKSFTTLDTIPKCCQQEDKTAKAFKIAKALVEKGLVKRSFGEKELSIKEFIELVEKIAKEI